ncbi:hypothetical protein PGT21_021020 [Puccinia graminis f. sp. tritici]|uniref:Uncharacterized protein n=1 Tax=Puccinia graminis f. sp. tritici TaxID=56615 RepID=A0A5B0MRS5_PUCGR|nr:hypothetical protein PGT21_021020 [Puccinia graminis f. sp. tritici]KAA1100840.1 hypothetical protein PGTUg99_030338 [Puccinia graminis f. sp. tritici]
MRSVTLLGLLAAIPGLLLAQAPGLHDPQLLCQHSTYPHHQVVPCRTPIDCPLGIIHPTCPENCKKWFDCCYKCGKESNHQYTTQCPWHPHECTEHQLPKPPNSSN